MAPKSWYLMSIFFANFQNDYLYFSVSIDDTVRVSSGISFVQILFILNPLLNLFFLEFLAIVS